MSKPEEFQQPYVALQHIPYVLVDALAKEVAPSGGVLRRGQTVWMKDIYEHLKSQRSTTAFVDQIGLISLDPRWLVRADALNQSGKEMTWQTR